MLYRKASILLIVALCVATGTATRSSAAGAPPGDVGWQAEAWRFLLTAHLDGGVAPDDPRAFAFPRSYYDSANYWAEEVCHWPARDCAVEDRYDPVTHTLLPPDTPAGQLQLERVAVHYGSNLYDTALWQVSMALEARGQSPAFVAQAWEQAVAPTRALRANAALRSPEGYAWRMIAPQWLLDDPLERQPWAGLISARALPTPPGDYRPGRITWNDWHPVTGENAWIRLIGPLQAARLHALAAGAQAVALQDEGLQLAIESLPVFARQQAPNGAFYFTAAPAVAPGAVGGERAVSIENNLSLYAGLQLLRATLQETSAHTAAATPGVADVVQIQNALAQLERLIEGSAGHPGLEAFLRGPAWEGHGFHTTGYVNAQTGAWRVAGGAQAVDVQSWGIAALGAQRLDAWHGAGTALKMWQSLRDWGGYGEGTRLLGVGYSDRDGNGRDAQGHWRAGVLSSEWTAGAIDAVRNLRAHYAHAPGASSAALAELASDEASMGEGFLRLRIDRYGTAGLPGADARLRQQVPVVGLPWLYASRRHVIPFGWVANPLPSTCATVWALLLDARYDPFGFGGAPN